MNYDQRYKGAFQTFIDEVTHDIARQKGGHTKYAAAESVLAGVLGCSVSSIQRYRRGASMPRNPLDTVLLILDYCVQEYRMDRAWTEKMLRLVRHPNNSEILARLYPGQSAYPQMTTNGEISLTSDTGPLKQDGAPNGVLPLTDSYYIKREVDTYFAEEILAWGTTITIRAPRQAGKSSLLVRGLDKAARHGISFVRLDIQGIGRDILSTKDRFLHYLATHIFDQLGLDKEPLEEQWQSALDPNDKLTYLIEDQLLSDNNLRLILALDEADRLMKTDYHQDFFGLIRAWHNERALNPSWKHLSVILVISTEPLLLIRDVSQSPFNVATEFNLDDFGAEHIRELNQRHGSPLTDNELSDLMALLRGHPYLTRQAFYAITTKHLLPEQLIEIATRDTGPFGQHLRHLYYLLHQDENLLITLKEVVQNGRCESEDAFFRLIQAGLVNGTKEKSSCRCHLYEAYFKDKFGW